MTTPEILGQLGKIFAALQTVLALLYGQINGAGVPTAQHFGALINPTVVTSSTLSGLNPILGTPLTIGGSGTSTITGNGTLSTLGGPLNASGSISVNGSAVSTSSLTTPVTVANGGTNKTSFTAGSLVFASGTTILGENNPNLFWDNVNNRLGIGTPAPSSTLHVVGGTQIAGNATTTNLTVTGVTGGLGSFSSAGVLSAYGGSSCTVGSLVTSISALGAVSCNTTSSILAGYGSLSGTNTWTAPQTYTATTTFNGPTYLPVGSSSTLANGGVMVSTNSSTFNYGAGGSQFALSPTSSIAFAAVSSSLTGDDYIWTANGNYKFTWLTAVNKITGDTCAFNFQWGAGRSSSTSAGAQSLLTATSSVTGTSTPVAIAITGSTTIATNNILRLVSAPLTSNECGITLSLQAQL